jgi:hypothetical protein
MPVILPDPRLEAPGLFYPGRKPVQPVAIDRDHPLAPNKYCFLMNGTVPPKNLAQDHPPPSLILESTSTLTAVTTDEGLAHFFNRSSEENVAAYQLEPIGPMPSGWIQARVRFPNASGGAADNMFCHGDYATGARIYFMQYFDSFQYRLGASSHGETDNVIFDNTWITLAISWSGGTCRVWVDGVRTDTYLYSGAPGSDENYTQIGCFKADEPTYPPQGGFEGDMQYMFVGTQYLTDNQAAQLMTDPYQFLVPA